MSAVAPLPYLAEPVHVGAGAKPVLVVDDEPEVLDLHRMLLQASGFSVTAAATLEEAVGHLDGTSFWALITDMHLSPEGGEGLRIIRHSSDTAPDTHVIVLTGSNDPAIEAEALRLGARHYLFKPFSLCRIVDLLTELDRSSSSPQIRR
jgi:DNA-binding NtrC family response regulator